MRILHCFTDIGGNASGLARAQRAAGANAEMVSFIASSLGFSGDRILAEGVRFPVEQERLRLRFFREALRSYDVMHFYFADTLLTPIRYPNVPHKPGHFTRFRRRQRLQAIRERALDWYYRHFWMRDLRLLRGIGKTVAMTFLGDDIRTVAYAGAHNPNSHLVAPENCAIQGPWDPDKERIIAKVSKQVDLIYATNPDLLGLLPKRAQYLPYCNIEPAKITPRMLSEEGPLHIAHAPTNRVTKGTDEVLAAVEQLQAEGLPITFELIEGYDHQEARARMAKADIFVDQLRVGWFGGAAAEAMAMGAIAMAHLHGPDIALSPYEEQDLPVVNITRGQLADQLRALVTRPRSELQAMAQRGRTFVCSEHDPARLAERTLQDYRNVPARWGRVLSYPVDR